MRIWQMLFRRAGEPKLRFGAVKHPAIGDFHTVVTKAGLSVTFKPTNSNYAFIRLADHSASFVGIQHAACNTRDYPSDEVQDMAQQIASDHSWLHFGQFFLDETADTHAR